jgi:hypothetical protein
VRAVSTLLYQPNIPPAALANLTARGTLAAALATGHHYRQVLNAELWVHHQAEQRPIGRAADSLPANWMLPSLATRQHTALFIVILSR